MNDRENKQAKNAFPKFKVQGRDHCRVLFFVLK